MAISDDRCQRTGVREDSENFDSRRPVMDFSDICHLISGKWRLLLPGASEPRLPELNPSGLQFGFPDCLRSQGHRSIVVVCNYEFGPITAEPCRAKARPLRPRRS